MNLDNFTWHRLPPRKMRIIHTAFYHMHYITMYLSFVYNHIALHISTMPDDQYPKGNIIHVAVFDLPDANNLVLYSYAQQWIDTHIDLS